MPSNSDNEIDKPSTLPADYDNLSDAQLDKLAVMLGEADELAEDEDVDDHEDET